MASTRVGQAVTVAIPSALYYRTDGRSAVTVESGTVREIISQLEHLHPGLRFNLCFETGELRPYVNIFLNKENIREMQDLDTPVPAGARLHILKSVAGG